MSTVSPAFVQPAQLQGCLKLHTHKIHNKAKAKTDAAKKIEQVLMNRISFVEPQGCCV